MLFLVITVGAFFLAALNFAGLRYERDLPDVVYRNEIFPVQMRLKNGKPFPHAFDVEIRDAVISRREREPVLFPVIAPGNTECRYMTARIAQRGLYHDFGVALSSSFPLGLASCSRTEPSQDTLIVYPRPRLPADIRDMLDAGVGSGGLRHTFSQDFLGEFKSMREYRTGDRPKRISWPFSTRFQRLIVKEIEQPRPKRVAVLFHSFWPPGVILSRRSFERSLQLLSGLFLYLSQRGIPFDFAADFTDWHTVAVAPGPGHQREVCILLATARMQTNTVLDKLTGAMRREHRLSVVQLIVSNTPVRYWAPQLPPNPLPIFCMDSASGGVARQRQTVMAS